MRLSSLSSMGLARPIRLARAAPVLAALTAAAIGACGGASASGSASSSTGAGGSTVGTSGTTSSSDSASVGTSSSSSGAGGGGGGTSTCAPSTSWAQGFVPMRELVVATTGSDGSGDGSAAKPWGSIAHALQASKPGDHITVKSGTYDCSSTFVDGAKGAATGTSDHPIWVSGEPGTVVDCGDPTSGSSSALQLSGVSYVVLEGLEMKNASGHVVHIDGHSNGVLLKSLFLHRAGLAVVKASQSDGVSIEDSELADSGLSSDNAASNASGQILDNVGVHNAHVVRTKIHGAMGNGSGSSANVAVQYKGGSHDIDIAQNDIADANTAVNLGGSTGAQFFDPANADYEGKNVFAWANTVTGKMDVAFAAVGCQACAITNNTVYAALGAQAIRALPGSSSTGAASHTQDFEVKNNLFVFAGGAPQDLFNAGPTETMGIAQASNLFFAAGLSIASLYSDVPVIGAAGVIIDQDPLLVAPPMDLHLGGTSPAIGAGVALPTRTADRAGTCRATWDIGAFAAH